MTSMRKMFSWSGFNQPIGGWDMRLVESTYGMFDSATYFNQVRGFS